VSFTRIVAAPQLGVSTKPLDIKLVLDSGTRDSVRFIVRRLSGVLPLTKLLAG
jgi:hypothetical protein